MRQGYGHMLLDDMVDRVRMARARRLARLQGVHRLDQALVYQSQVRQAIRQAFGPWPERTPLNARTVDTLYGPGFTVEKVVLESRSDCLVTANLYLPEAAQAVMPCVLGTCGHVAEGKAAALYQGFSQRLAQNGFVVLIYDPINQGERDQYADLANREAVVSCTSAHNMMGKQQELIGDFFGMWRAWDGIRALDYLLSRPEVDPQRVGLTGNSGGGTVSTWLWALDDRFTMAAPGCFVTTFLANLENELPADCEQYPPGVLGEGLEMADFIIAGAPKPVLLLGQHYDFFDRRGMDEAADEIRSFYDVLGAPTESLDCFRGPHGHGYFEENQERMVAFFAHHAGLAYRAVEPTLFLVDALNVLPPGGVIAAGARPVYQFTSERAHALAQSRPRLQGNALRAEVARLLGLRDERPVPHYRNLRPCELGGEIYARYAIETERAVRAILHKRVGDGGHAHSLDVTANICLYVPHYASEEDLITEAGSLAVHVDEELYALNVRGLGETAPDDVGSFWQPYGNDYMLHGYELLFGQSYLGRRVWDLLVTIELLLAEGAERVRLAGRGQGALIALFAALHDERIDHVTLWNMPRSYQEWTEAPLVMWPAANMLRGVLKSFDLPDCIAELGPRIEVSDPWDALMRPV